jgi:predicted DNA-binding transcriptional regulator YafY
MYFPTTRVLTILEMLQSHRRLRGQELADRLEVDVRTIRRYITMLQDLGIPVEAERGRYGAYYLRPGFKLPPMMFTDDEALAVVLGLLAARKIGLASEAPAIEGAIAKVERVLPEAVRAQVQAVQETLVMDFAPPRTMPRNDIVVTLSAAVQQRKCVRMVYRAFNEEETTRVVDAYGLVCRPGYWYAVGYCHLRQDMRSFRLDRIVGVELCEEGFTRPEDFDCLAFVLRAIPNTPAKYFVEVLLETTLEQAQCMVPPAAVVLDQVEEGVLLHCYVDRLDWMAYVLIGLRCAFVVRQPEELRDVLRGIANDILCLSERN